MATLLGQMTCGTQYYNIIAFLPLFVSKHYGDTINASMVSCALCAFQVAAVIFPKVHAVTIHRMGRKNAIILGFAVMSIATFALGALALIPYDNWKLFLVSAMLTRFIQGYGDSLAQTTMFSMIT